jgi:hypothetical protein
MIERAFWRNRRVLLTGHTGFKGTWLGLWLEQLGAEVFGLALPPDTDPALYTLLQPMPRLHSTLGDIRDPDVVDAAVAEARPQVVIHMAAQSLVRRSDRNPVDTVSAIGSPKTIRSAALTLIPRPRQQPNIWSPACAQASSNREAWRLQPHAQVMSSAVATGRRTA